MASPDTDRAGSPACSILIGEIDSEDVAKDALEGDRIKFGAVGLVGRSHGGSGALGRGWQLLGQRRCDLFDGLWRNRISGSIEPLSDWSGL